MPHPPPEGIGAEPDADADDTPVAAKTDSSRIAPSCPSGHDAGAEASLIGRRISNVDSQVRQRYS